MGFVKTDAELELLTDYAETKLDKPVVFYEGAKTLLVALLLKEEDVSRLLPPPLEPGPLPVAFLTLSDFPRSWSQVVPFRRAYNASMLALACQHKGIMGSYPLGFLNDQEGCAQLGRHGWGLPVKIGETMVSVTGETVSASSRRENTELAAVSASLGAAPNNEVMMETLMSSLFDENGELNLKSFSILQSPYAREVVEGWAEIPAYLSICNWRNVPVSATTARVDSLELRSSKYDAWGELDVVEVIGAMMSEASMELSRAKPIERVDMQTFRRHMYVAYDWDV